MAGHPTVRFQPVQAPSEEFQLVYPVRGQRAGNRFRIVALSNSYVLNSNWGFQNRPEFESYPVEKSPPDMKTTNLDLKSRDILANKCFNKLTNEDDNPKENIELPSSISSSEVSIKNARSPVSSSLPLSKLPYSPTAFRKLRGDV